jgi:hypothetical protein
MKATDLSRRLLQVACGLSAIHFITGGGFYLWRGVDGLSLFTPLPLPINTGDPMWANIDYMYRAFAGIWTVQGVMLAYIIPAIERQTAWFRLIFLAVFAMGVGRLLSLIAFGPAPGNSQGAMIAELALPVAYVFWQYRVAGASSRSRSEEGAA